MAIMLSLTSIPVFSFLAPGDAQKLQGIARAVTKTRGDAVVMHDEPVAGIYIVAEGSVGVYPPGAIKPLLELQAGEAFGEMSFIEKSRASATIRAEAKITKLAIIMQQELEKLIAADPQVGAAIYRGIAFNLSRKLRATTERIAHELSTGRRLLSELTAETQPQLVFEDLARSVEQFGERVGKDLDGVNAKLQELSRKLPEKLGSFAEMDRNLSDMKAACKAFHPRLAQQVSVMARFIRAVEKFVLESNS